MLKAIGVKAIVIGVIAGSAAFLAGCTSQDVAGLYVDAVVLTEMRQTDLAVEKLNTAVKANPRFSDVLRDGRVSSGRLRRKPLRPR